VKQKKVFFSIVIPTRNRHETLRYTIQTILEQDFKDYELIICDNNSSKETQELVASFNSKHIKYIHSDKDLAMSDNWELALSHTSGKYITVIADNDGFINGSLGYLYKQLIKHKMPEIIRWEKNSYYWPDMDVHYVKRLGIKTGVKTRVLTEKEVAFDVLNAKASFHLLPMIYCSVVSSSLLEKLKKKTNKVFHSRSPDIYSGFAFLYLVQKYISIDTPITINGTSKKSNGFNCSKAKNDIKSEFVKLNEIAGYPRHKYLPNVRASGLSGVFDSFLYAKERLKIDDISLGREEIVDKLIKSALVYNEEELQIIKKKFIESVYDDKELLKYTKKAIERLKVSEPEPPKNRLGFYENVLYLDGEKFNINNIYEASQFMEQFYNYAEVN